MDKKFIDDMERFSVVDPNAERRLEEFRTCFTLSLCVSVKPPPLQIKGGFMPNQATHIIITSNLPPEDQYVNCNQLCRDALMRRC